MPTVNTPITASLYLFDAAGVPITGANLLGFTASARLLGAATTASVSISETGDDGEYECAFTPSAAGSWRLRVTYAGGTTERIFSETYDVTEDLLSRAATGSAGTVGGMLARIGSGRVTINNAVGNDRALTLVRGDAYLTANDRALEWIVTTGPDLTGATATLAITFRDETDTFAATISGQTVTVELSELETTGLPGGTASVGHAYELVAELANAATATLASGPVTITEGA